MEFSDKDSVVTLLDVVKEFIAPSGEVVRAVDGISLVIAPGELVSLMGPSGSGKSTLLNLLVGLDQATAGEVLLVGEKLNGKSEDALAQLRSTTVGFVFQDFHLLPALSALENVMLPLEILGHRERRDRAAAILERVGLANRLTHYPYQLSGGEQQRVAVARAYVHTPKLLLADEPTGNLDFETGVQIASLLLELNREHGTAMIIATHDRELAAKTARCVLLQGGTVKSDQRTR